MAKRVRLEEPFCRRCGRPAQVADHIVPIRAGGARLDRDNLQGLCRRCNAAKGYEDRNRKRFLSGAPLG